MVMWMESTVAKPLYVWIKIARSKVLAAIQPSNIAKILFVPSFAVSFLILYFMYPESYERTWKGRAYYIFFLWLILLELALNWDKIGVNVQRGRSRRFAALVIVALLPTVYVLAANFSGLNALIMNLSPKHYGLDWWSMFMPLTTEYLIFAALSIFMVILAYGIKGLRLFLPSITLVGTVGLIFLIDNLYPFGEFSPFQIFVPSSALIASKILALMGYGTEFIGQIHGTPVLRVWGESGAVAFGIAWPCSGIDSLIIYSIITILFLRGEAFSWKWKIIYFLAGAVITYVINALRIARIFMLAIEYGATSVEVQRFHDYYGPLYSITWIIAYQIIMVVGAQIPAKISRRMGRTSGFAD